MSRTKFEVQAAAFRLAKEDQQAIQAIADRMQVSFATVNRMAIREYLERQQAST